MLSDGGRINYCARETLRLRPQHVLDIGCGFGFVLSRLDGRVQHLVGVDMDATGLEKARAAAPSARLVHQTAAELPFPSESFDVAILSDVLEHVGRSSISVVVREARRVLKPTGHLILTAPHAGITAALDPMDVKRRFQRLYGAYSRVSGYQPTTPPEIGHQHFRVDEICDVLSGSFAPLTVDFAGFLEPLLLWLQVFADRVLRSRQAEAYLNRARSWESGIRYPRSLAYNMRMVCQAL